MRFALFIAALGLAGCQQTSSVDERIAVADANARNALVQARQAKAATEELEQRVAELETRADDQEAAAN